MLVITTPREIQRRPFDHAARAELRRALLQAQRAAALWSHARRDDVLELATEAARHRVRTYLIGPPDLGGTLVERAHLRAQAARLLARRGVVSAVDLIIADAGQTAALLMHEGESTSWIRLQREEARAAFGWFSHLFWHRTWEEGVASPAGYRFRPCPHPFADLCPPPAADAPLLLSQEEGAWHASFPTQGA